MLENIALFLSQVSHGSISSRVHKVSDFIFDPESDHLDGGLLKLSLRFFRKHLSYDLKTDFCLVSLHLLVHLAPEHNTFVAFTRYFPQNLSS